MHVLEIHAVRFASKNGSKLVKLAQGRETGAPLYPAARPAKTSTAEAFVDRMKGLASSEMQSFAVLYLGSDIQAFGNVAVAFAAIEMVEASESL